MDLLDVLLALSLMPPIVLAWVIIFQFAKAKYAQEERIRRAELER